MFGARVSFLILSLSSFYQDLETTDVKCDIGAPPKKDFSLSILQVGVDSYYYTSLTNSKIFTDSICLLGESFIYSTYDAVSRPNSFGEKQSQSAGTAPRVTNYKNGKLSMDYLPQKATKIFTVLSGNYTVLATDYLSYFVLGACLESFEKPFIRVLTRERWLSDVTEEIIRSDLKSLGFDESKFKSTNSTGCTSF
ncbi:uncharacterized protein [Periplaneta americana]|uniref:uncharacterized protein n=1 Tax=Periplaneta americana TaxID=6978 RepID=UPI0037E7B13F